MFIDEKGKLFGKINIIDLLAILFIIYLAVIFYQYRKLRSLEYNGVNKNKNTVVVYVPQVVSQPSAASQPSNIPETLAPKNTEQDLYIKVRFDSFESFIVNFISVGDEKKDDSTVEVREIISIESAYARKSKRIHKNPELKSIVLKISLKAKKENDKFIYQGQLLELGSQFIFKTDKYEMNGDILEIKE